VQLIFESAIVKKKRKIQKFMGTTMSACWNNGKIKLRSVVSRIILAQKKNTQIRSLVLVVSSSSLRFKFPLVQAILWNHARWYNQSFT